jgi:hypothetical protein
MTNPNNCTTCEYKQMKEVGQQPDQFCYMFQDAPQEQCMQHTGYKEEDAKLMSSLATLAALAEKGLLKNTTRVLRSVTLPDRADPGVISGVTDGIYPVRGK